MYPVAKVERIGEVGVDTSLPLGVLAAGLVEPPGDNTRSEQEQRLLGMVYISGALAEVAKAKLKLKRHEDKEEGSSSKLKIQVGTVGDMARSSSSLADIMIEALSVKIRVLLTEGYEDGTLTLQDDFGMPAGTRINQMNTSIARDLATELLPGSEHAMDVTYPVPWYGQAHVGLRDLAAGCEAVQKEFVDIWEKKFKNPKPIGEEFDYGSSDSR
jgi:hypothetical protein